MNASQSQAQSKETMIREIVRLLKKLYWEDFEFFYKFLTGYARKKGIE